MIKEVCQKMKEKRASLGYSIEETVEKTKLHPSVIRDIEAGNLENIDLAYLKGFIRIYASFLGVEAEEALGEIKSISEWHKKEKKAIKKDIASDVGKALRKIKKVSPQTKKKIAIVILAVIALWIFVVFVKFISGKISQISIRKSTEVRQIGKVQQLPAISLAKNEQLSVSLTAKKKCFVKAIVDKKILFEGVLEKGAVETWEGNKEVEFKISDGSAVHLEVNGKELPTLSSIHKPIKSLKITSSGITVDK